MQKLIHINTNDNGEQLVSGRDLHEFLEIESKYTDWIKRMIEYGFEDNKDFLLVAQKRATNNPKNPFTNFIDHALKIDMAKEISMIQRTEKGKQARQYFIECEKQLKKNKTPITHNITGQQLLEIAKQMIELEEKRKEEETKKKKAWSAKGGITKNRNFHKQKANVLSEENEALREELGRCKEYATITAVQRYVKADYQWKKLKDYCTAKELEIIKVRDPRWGTANSYPAKAWLNIYNIDLEDLF